METAAISNGAMVDWDDCECESKDPHHAHFVPYTEGCMAIFGDPATRVRGVYTGEADDQELRWFRVL